MRSAEIVAGDRVKVFPKDAPDFQNEWGTVDRVLDLPGNPLDGALYVRMDLDGTLLGCGPEIVIGHRGAHA